MYRYITGIVECEIKRPPSIEVSIKNPRTLMFEFDDIQLHGGDYPHYEGEYVVTPRIFNQVLETDEKLMKDNLTVLGIPAAGISNPQGGKTITIG